MRQVVKKYRTLDYSQRLLELLSLVYPNENLAGLNKFDLHLRINEIAQGGGSSESTLKKYLFNYFSKKKVIAAFEIRVNDSRSDFLAINGHTYNFEIKSGLDNLTKLSRQATSYLKVFEFNHVLIDEKHLGNSLKLLPPSFGIWSFHDNKRKIYRPASLNDQIDHSVQLSLLTKKELNRYYKSASTNDILKSHDGTTINRFFKDALKERYFNRWNFLVQHAPAILPIDLQFFFNRNIEPKYIYH